MHSQLKTQLYLEKIRMCSLKTKKRGSTPPFLLALFFSLIIILPGYSLGQTNRFCDGFEAIRCGGLTLDLANVWPRPNAKESTSNPENVDHFLPTQIFVKLPEDYRNDKTRLLLDGVDVTPIPFIIENGFLTSLVDRVDEGLHHVEVKAGSETAGWSFTAGDPPPYLGIDMPVRSLPGIVKIKVGFNDLPIYGGHSSGIDISSLSVKLDGVDVTALGAITPTSFTFSKSFNSGEHDVKVSIADNLGYVQERFREFSVGATPEFDNCISGTFDFDELLTVGCDVRDMQSSIKDSSVKGKLRLASVGIISGTISYVSKSPNRGRIIFVPSQKLASGIYHFEASIKNELGIESGVVKNFFIGKKHESSINFISPTANQIFEQPRIVARITAKNWQSFVDTVKLNGKIALPKRVGKEIGFETELLLSAGTNQIRAEVLFQNGESYVDSINVTYDAPPEISIASPSDWQSFGPIPGAPSPGNSLNLTGNVERPIEINGSTSSAVVKVVINQQQATLSADNKQFRFPNFFLHEGNNVLNIAATDARERTISKNVTVYVDQTAPIVSIGWPQDTSVTSNQTVDVRGLVNDAVAPLVGAELPRVEVKNLTNEQVVIASVNARNFFARGVPLEVGLNRLEVTAIDKQGNRRIAAVSTSRIAVGSKRISVLSGNYQSGSVKSRLPRALEVVAFDEMGSPLANEVIHFDVQRGSGSISSSVNDTSRTDGVNPDRNIEARTDSTGRARVWFTMGAEAGPGANSVRVWSARFNEDLSFFADATPLPPSHVLSDALSTGQYVATESTPVEALTANVYDQFYNRISAAKVRFRILDGQAKIISVSKGQTTIDGQSALAISDAYGVVSVRPVTRDIPGTVTVVAEALLENGQTVGQAVFQLIVLKSAPGPTKFSGVVMNHTGLALPGVRVSISRTNLSASTDSRGRFQFASQVPPGKIDLFVDGRGTSSDPNREYPALHFEAAVISGQNNQLPHPIYLPPIDLARSVIVGGSQDVSIRMPGFDGFEMIVKANSVTFPDGTHVGQLVISPVHNDRLPMIPQGGGSRLGSIAWTVQPTGTRFDPPIEVRLPNIGNMRPGAVATLVQWDHDLATFVPIGTATVTEDSAQIVSDVFSGISKAGWGSCTPETCNPTPPNCVNSGPNSCRGGICRACSPCEQELLSCGGASLCFPDPLKSGKKCPTDASKICVFSSCEKPTVKITGADLKTDKIELEFFPAVPVGEVKVSLVDSNGSLYELYNGLPKAEISFNSLDDIPVERFTKVRAEYTVDGVAADDSSYDYKFTNLGKKTHTQYNTPLQSNCSGPSQTWYIVRKEQNIVTQPGEPRRTRCPTEVRAVNRGFLSYVNGTTAGSGTGKFAEGEYWGQADFCKENSSVEFDPPLPPGWPRTSINFVRATAVGRYLPELSDSTVAACPTELGQPRGKDMLLIGFPDGTVVKTVTDRCGECCDHPEKIDNYNLSETCTPTDIDTLGSVTTIILGR